MARFELIDGHDGRVTHETANLNGQTYHYLLGVPQGGKYKVTVFLVCRLLSFTLLVIIQCSRKACFES
jgi:hypothetical protein